MKVIAGPSLWLLLTTLLLSNIHHVHCKRGRGNKDGGEGKRGKKGEIVRGLKPEYLKMRDTNNKSETPKIETFGVFDVSKMEKDHIKHLEQRHVMNMGENESLKLHKKKCKNDRIEKSDDVQYNALDLSKEEQKFLERAQMNLLNKKSKNDDKESHDLEHNLFDQSDFSADSRDVLRKRLEEHFPVDSKDKIDMSLEIQKINNVSLHDSPKDTELPKRVRRNVEGHEKLFRLYRTAISTTTEWQEWRNISGTMKRFPRYTAYWNTRNKHFKLVQEYKRKLKKEEIIKRYNEKSYQLRKKYHQGLQLTRGEVKKVKGKMSKKKEEVFKDFFKTTRMTLPYNINNYRRGLVTELHDGMSGSQSALYYKDGEEPVLPTGSFDSEKTVESNYINDTLIKNLGLKLNARERKELNKNLKKFEVVDHHTLAQHFYEDYREDIFKKEEEIFGQRATTLDMLDGLQLLPYILREKTLPPGPPLDNTLEEVIRNCRYLDLENFRKLGEQKLARYVLKVHDRRKKNRNITMKTTIHDSSVISARDEEEFMKRITIKSVPGRLLYNHEKLYDKILRNKFKYKKVIYNDSLCWAYRELTKLAPVYVTIVPKKNLTSIGDAQEEDAFLLGHMFHLCQKLAYDLKMREGYRVVINNGHAGNHNHTHLNILLIGGRQMRYPKDYDLSHWTSARSAIDHSLSTYGDNFHLSGRMADFFGSYGSLKAKRAKWLSSKYPKMCQGSPEI